MISGDGVSDVDIILCMWLMYYVFMYDHSLWSKLPHRNIKVLLHSVDHQWKSTFEITL